MDKNCEVMKVYNKPDGRPLLEVEGLKLSFPQFLRGLEETYTQVISDFTLFVETGEIVAIVGTSGSGKSLLADAILGILPQNSVLSGSIFYKGEALNPKKQKQLRGTEITLIPQS